MNYFVCDAYDVVADDDGDGVVAVELVMPPIHHHPEYDGDQDGGDGGYENRDHDDGRDSHWLVAS